MKTVILAGGLGSRLAEETTLRPKPMVAVGQHPMLWHIMSIYAHYGLKDFVIALGYKGEYIKRYFLDYHALQCDLSIDLSNGQVVKHGNAPLDWRVKLIDTGVHTLTGGRVARLRETVGSGTFMVTYGDGVADIDINALLKTHREGGRLATVTAVRPPARFGGLHFDGDAVSAFSEKPQIGEGWINGGFLVFEPEIFDLLSHDDDSLEVTLLEKLATQGQLSAYRHEGFWQCADTLRDLNYMRDQWNGGTAPWKVW